MSKVIYRRGEQIVEIDEFRIGTRNILEQGGFRLVQPEIEPIPEENWALGDIPEDVYLALAAVFDSPDAIVRASDDEILAIKGIGPATLQKIREALG